MIQLLALNKIIKNHDGWLLEHTTMEHFCNYRDEYIFISDWYKVNGTVPPENEVLMLFPSFVLVNTTLTYEEILTKLQEERIYYATTKFVKEHKDDPYLKEHFIEFSKTL